MTKVELLPVEGDREAFLPLLLEADESEEMVRTYLELLRLVPVVEIGLPEGLDHLDRTLGLVEATFETLTWAQKTHLT